MIKIGLTGNYYSGMEDIVDIFKRYKIPVFDADLLIKYLLYNNNDIKLQIKSTFGNSVYKDNQLNMSEFKGNGFTKDNGTFKFEKLLKLLQTDLIKHYEKWRLVNKESKYTIFKSQILFENNYDDFMNLTISVFKPDSIRVSEMQESTKMKAMEIYNLLDNEMDPYTKNIKCTYTIHNYENFTESLERQIAQIHKSILGKIPKIKYEYT